jgi:hypothetical protein
MAKSRRGKCPPGVFCISGDLSTTIFIILSVALLFFLYAAFFTRSSNDNPIIIMPRTESASPNTTIIPIKGGDSRYDMAPQPYRSWMAPPEFPPRGGIASIPINIPTQGLPESFQSVGVVRVDDKILPLYGRRTMTGSDRWNYYTRTDTYNPVPIPINFQRRQCMDDVGCQEILSGDEVKVDVMNKSGKTSIYKIDGPKYIPGLI